MRTVSNRPIRKVAAATLAGALSAPLVWGLDAFALPPDKQIPAAVASALITLISTAIAYLTPPGPDDGLNDGPNKVPSPAARNLASELRQEKA